MSHGTHCLDRLTGLPACGEPSGHPAIIEVAGDQWDPLPPRELFPLLSRGVYGLRTDAYDMVAWLRTTLED